MNRRKQKSRASFFEKFRDNQHLPPEAYDLVLEGIERNQKEFNRKAARLRKEAERKTDDKR